MRRLRPLGASWLLRLAPLWRLLHAVLGLQRPIKQRSVRLVDLPGQVTHALVLGAGVDANGAPSQVLLERLDRAVELAAARPDLTMLVSGDAAAAAGGEDACMAAHLKAQGVAPDRIVRDGGGVSTRDSIVRARDVFAVQSLVMVTNDFHVSRALHLAVLAGIDAHAVNDFSSRQYSDADRPLQWDERRELIAHIKDVAAFRLARLSRSAVRRR